MRKLKFLGIILFIVGIVLSIRFIPNITGFVVSENSSFLWWKILGPIFILGGIFLMISEGRNEKSKLVDMIESGENEEIFNSPAMGENYDKNMEHIFGENMEKYRGEINELLDLAKYTSGDTVVDLGCGTGISTEEIVKRKYGRLVGVDTSESMLDQARKKLRGEKNIELKVASAGELSKAVSDADKIISVNTFSYFSNPDEVLGEIYDSLQPNGEYLFNVRLKTPERQSVSDHVYNAIENVLSKKSGKKVRVAKFKGLDPKYTREDIEEMAERNHLKIKEYKERPIVYDGKTLRNMHEQVLGVYELKLVDVLGEGESQEVFRDVRDELNKLYKSEKSLVGTEAYVSLEKS